VPRLARTLTLPAERESVGQARRALRAALTEAGGDRWTGDAELALSEIATNAVLHAHSRIDLDIRVFDDCVYVSVHDLDPTPPVARHYGSEATTGRGLDLVARLTSRYGAQRDDTGKLVWFCIGDAELRDEISGEGEWGLWDVEAWDLGQPGDADHPRQVVLEGMPTALWLAARQHHDAVLRDLTHLLVEEGGPDFDLAGIDRARSSISVPVAAAAAAGDDDGSGNRLPSIDLVVLVPPENSSMFGALQDVLDYAESLAVQNRLLVKPGLPEIIAVRDWACEQVIAQLAGVAPSPWPGTAHERFETEVHPQMTPIEWDTAVIDNSDRAVLAADDANRIVAASDSFLELIGWERSELIGRRVVTIVPPAMRESHVAGFSRHLTTSETRVIGREVELPVLRRDGTEILCRIKIERAEAGPHRAIFVAWAEVA
jgi:PAS domain S-box-containing protein